MPKHDRETGLHAGSISEEDGMDATTRDAIVRRLAPRQTNLVGNFADLQRAGGLIATGQASSFSEGVELPPNVSESDAKATVKAEAVADKLVTDVAASVEAASADVDIKKSAKAASDDKKS